MAWSKGAHPSPDNGDRGLPAIQASYLLMEKDTGLPVAVLDGTELTRLRTAAASAFAADYLAPKEVREHLLLGAGNVCAAIPAHYAAVRSVALTRVWARRTDQAVVLVDRLRERGSPRRWPPRGSPTRSEVRCGSWTWPPDLDDLRLECDVLVNNAGLQKVAPVTELLPADFRLLHRVMLEAPFLLCRAALPHMYAQGWGRIINISSVHGLRASAFKSAYVSAKHGLEGLSKVLALEGAPHGVTSVCINPGYVRTPLVERQIADQAVTHGIPEDEVVATVMMTRSPVKRMVEPEEVAALAAFVMSDDAAMVTGASYTVDGGWTAQ